MGASLFGEIVKRADLLSVRPVLIHVSRGRGHAPDGELSLDSDCTYETDEERKILSVIYTYKVKQEQQQEGAGADGFRATSAYELIYTFSPPLAERHETELEAFAVHNGRFNSWSYLRTFLSHITAEMELPVLTLPLLKPSPRRKPSEARRGAGP